MFASVYTAVSIFAFLLTAFIILESVVNKKEKNGRWFVHLIVFFVAQANAFYLLTNDPFESARVSACNNTKKLNSENVISFAESCIFHDLEYKKSERIETTSSGNLVTLGMSSKDSKLIEESYSKVIEYISENENPNSRARLELNKLAGNAPIGKNIRFLSKKEFKRERLLLLEDEFKEERNKIALDRDEYTKLIEISRGAYKGSLTLAEIEYYQNKLNLMQDAKSKVIKWHDFIEEACNELKDSCLDLKTQVLSLASYIDKVDYLQATKVLSSTRLAIDQKIDSDFKSIKK